MKMFKNAIVMLLLLTLALLPVAGLGEEAEESAEDAFETLRALMEEPSLESIPAIRGSSMYAPVVSVEAARAVSINTAPTPVDIVCQIQIDNKNKDYGIVISAINDVSIDEMVENNADVEALIGKENVDKTDVKYRLYEAVSYTGLTKEQILYYNYMISSGYSEIQNKLPFGMTLLIVIKYGENGMIMLNDEKTAADFRESIVKIVSSLAGE